MYNSILHMNTQESQTCLWTNLVKASLIINTRASRNYSIKFLFTYTYVVHVSFGPLQKTLSICTYYVTSVFNSIIIVLNATQQTTTNAESIETKTVYPEWINASSELCKSCAIATYNTAMHTKDNTQLCITYNYIVNFIADNYNIITSIVLKKELLVEQIFASCKLMWLLSTYITMYICDISVATYILT